MADAASNDTITAFTTEVPISIWRLQQLELDTQRARLLQTRVTELEAALQIEHARGEKTADALANIARSCDDRAREMQDQHAAAIAVNGKVIHKLEDALAEATAATFKWEATVVELKAENAALKAQAASKLNDIHAAIAGMQTLEIFPASATDRRQFAAWHNGPLPTLQQLLPPHLSDANDDEDDDPLMAKRPKKKHPVDAVPLSPLVLDAWKREYSNNDTRTKAAPWFFENFDASGYSAYWCKYKYNSDLKMQFMTANLVRGWFQRMEGNRKYAFGVVLIVGEEGNHEIRGFWVFRGQPPLPECVLDVEDTELFEWTHIPDVKAEKEAITDYLCWEGPTIDKPVMEGRTFK